MWRLKPAPKEAQTAYTRLLCPNQFVSETVSQILKHVLRLWISANLVSVCHGGTILAFVHAAASDHMTNSTRSARHLHARNFSANFLRPTFPEPEVCLVSIKEVSVNKAWTTAQIEVSQKGKLCVVGYITYVTGSIHGSHLRTLH